MNKICLSRVRFILFATASAEHRKLHALLFSMLLAMTVAAQTIPVTTSSTAAKAQYKKGLASVDQHLMVDAARAFQQAYTIDPDFALARMMFVYHSYALQRPVNTTEELTKATEAAAKFSPGEQKFVAAAKAEFDGYKNEARRVLEELVMEFPDDAEARNRLGLLYYFSFQEYALAAEQFREGHRRHPQLVQFLNNMGYSLMQLGKLPEAEAVLKEAIELAPGQANGYDSMGDFYLAIKDYDKAIEQYQVANSLHPGYSKNDLAEAMAAKTNGYFLNVSSFNDSSAVSKVFTPSAFVFSPQGHTYRGAAAISQFWQEEIVKRGTNLNLTKSEIRFAENWACEMGKYNGKAIGATAERNYTIIWVSTPEGLRIDRMLLQ